MRSADWIREMVAGLRSLVTRRRVEEDLDEELRFHLEMEADANRRRGLEPAAARRAARVGLGGIERTKEEVRDQYWFRWVDDARQDVPRFALPEQGGAGVGRGNGPGARAPGTDRRGIGQGGPPTAGPGV